jgi:hypothetical protein
MNSFMAHFADDQGLAPYSSHFLYPERLFLTARLLQVSKFSDMVDLDVLGTATHLASIGE